MEIKYSDSRAKTKLLHDDFLKCTIWYANGMGNLELTLIFRYVYGTASSCPSSTTEWSLYSSIAGKVIVDPTLKVACA